MPRLSRPLRLSSVVATLALAACGQDPPPSTRSAALALSMSPPGAAPRLFVGGGDNARQAGGTPADTAVAYVARLAPDWGAPGGPAALAPIATVTTHVGDVVRLTQSLDGVAVDGRELRVLVRPDGRLGAASGTMIPADRPRRGRFALTPADAVARAVAVTHGVGPAATSLALEARAAADDEAWFRGARGARPYVEQARARKRWHDAGDHLQAAWVIEAYSAPDDHDSTRAFRTVVSATDGAILARVDLQADDVGYRVWAEPGGDRRPLDGPTADITPHPTGMPGAPRPALVDSALVQVGGLNHPVGGGPADPWLPVGATETLGNHVDAYADLAMPDGLSPGDFRVSTTAAGGFDRPYDFGVGAVTARPQQEAALTQLFYTLNWLHDDWYDAGFTEAAGNAQADNFGRGGAGGDRMLAELQDHSGRNNANMTTPGDGFSPRMQVFLYTGLGDATVTVQPGGQALSAIGAEFDPMVSDVTGPLVAGVDGTAPIGDGCEAQNGDVAGKVVLIDRGQCLFEPKAARAQAAGAIAVVIANNVDAPFPGAFMTDDANTTAVITIPVMLVTRADGAALRAGLAAGPLAVRLQRQRADRDAALDNLVLAHEYGHYLHHRLSLCFTAQCQAMSEGWGDFVALHLAARAGDDLDGTFAYGGFENLADPYFGVRRVPYSVDLERNALTFRHMADDAELPTGHPRQVSGWPNSEVHNAGEVWASMLWEAYVALQRSRPSFAETRRAMAGYVVAGLLLAPDDATVTEARDALLLAAHLASPADHAVLAAAFARRGAGTCAVSADRGSVTLVGVVESFELKGMSQASAPTLTIDVEDCDGDRALDVGETATLRTVVGNTGAVGLGPLTVTLTTTTPGLAIRTEPIVVPAIPAFGSVPISFAVTLEGASAATAGDLTVTVTAADACNPTLVVQAPVRLNADDRPAASAADAFDAEPSVWALTGDDAGSIWSHQRVTGLDGEWLGADAGSTSLTGLVSPPMIAGTGPVTLTFDLAHHLEADASAQYDGLVLEISTDDGASWRDVGAMASPGYTGLLFDESDNPLGGRPAYSGRSPGYPAKRRVTVNLGTTVAGQTFRFRFLIATDNTVGAPGVQLDDVAVTGLTSPPFPVQVDDGGACGVPPDDDDDDGGCCQAGPPRAGNLLAALLVLGLVGGRRRQQRRS